jgi:hypothetical protein
MNVRTMAALVGVGTVVGAASVGTISGMEWARMSGRVSPFTALAADLGVTFSGAAALATAWSMTGGSVGGYALLGTGLLLGGGAATLTAMHLVRGAAAVQPK